MCRSLHWFQRQKVCGRTVISSLNATDKQDDAQQVAQRKESDSKKDPILRENSQHWTKLKLASGPKTTCQMQAWSFFNQTKSCFLQSETFYRNPNEPLAWAPVAPVRFTGPRRVNEPTGTTMFREENHLDRKRFSKLYSSEWKPSPSMSKGNLYII